MSYRVCKKCDWVINNRVWNEKECPSCGSKEMINPLDDDRDWNKLYKKQKEKLFNYYKSLKKK